MNNSWIDQWLIDGVDGCIQNLSVVPVWNWFVEGLEVKQPLKPGTKEGTSLSGAKDRQAESLESLETGDSET